MLPRNNSDRMQITFDDHRLVANADLLLGHPGPAPWACRNSSTITSTQEARRGRPTRGTRCRRWSLPRWRAATVSTTPTCCAPGGRPVRFPPALGEVLTPASIRSQPSPPDKPPWASIYRWKNSATVLL